MRLFLMPALYLGAQEDVTMKFQCNIEKTGRVLRLAAGAILLFDGVMFVVLGIPGTGIVARLVQAALVLLGAFTMFEGIVGWCAIRAMGFKTRI